MELPPTPAAKSEFICYNFIFIHLIFPRIKKTILNESRSSSIITVLFVIKFKKKPYYTDLLKSVHGMHADKQ
jgi:hypothetical protein